MKIFTFKGCSNLKIYQSQSLHNSSIPFTKYNEKNKLAFHSTAESSTSIASEKIGSSDIWSELSQNYDIRSATYEEIEDISSKLYESGEISLIQKCLLTEDKRNSRYFSVGNLNANRDWLQEFENKAAQQLKFGNMDGYVSFQNLVTNILKRLE